MQALQLFKTAGVWDDIKGYLDNDYVKYPAIGAGIGGLGMGAASAIGGPGEGVEEKPNEKRNRILGSAVKGMGFGGTAGLGAAGLKDWFTGDSGASVDSADIGDEKLESEGKTWTSPEQKGIAGIGAVAGLAGGYGIAGREIANADKATDVFNTKANGIVENIKGQMGGGSNQEAIDALKKTYKATNDPDILDQIDKLKGAAKPRSLQDLMSRLHDVPVSHAGVATGAAAHAMGHAGTQPGPFELDANLAKTVGNGDASHQDSILKKLFAKVAPGATGMENLAAQTKNYAANGFHEKPHLDFLGRSGKRIGWGVGGAAMGAAFPTLVSGVGTALFGSSDKYNAPTHSKSPDIH